VFLFDEPLSNLDAALRARMRVELKKMHARLGATMIYVTHDQVEAMTLGDRVVVMREGRVHQIGPPGRVYSRPADTFVATFIGSPEMNLHRGRLVRKDDCLHFQGSGFTVALMGLKPGLQEGEVELGTRPEDIGIGRGDTTDLEGKIEMISDVGSEKYIHARVGQERLTVRAPKEIAYRTGDTVPLAIHPGRVHLFREGLRI